MGSKKRSRHQSDDDDDDDNNNQDYDSDTSSLVSLDMHRDKRRNVKRWLDKALDKKLEKFQKSMSFPVPSASQATHGIFAGPVSSSSASPMRPPARPGYYGEQPQPMSAMYGTSPPTYPPQTRFSHQSFQQRVPPMPYWGTGKFVFLNGFHFPVCVMIGHITNFPPTLTHFLCQTSCLQRNLERTLMILVISTLQTLQGTELARIPAS